MNSHKHETLKAIFEAITASNQKIFGICVSLIAYFPFVIEKSAKIENVFPGLFTNVHFTILLQYFQT